MIFVYQVGFFVAIIAVIGAATWCLPRFARRIGLSTQALVVLLVALYLVVMAVGFFLGWFDSRSRYHPDFEPECPGPPVANC